MLKKIKIAVLGATGYTGLDLVKLLSKHPKAQVVYLCATKSLGKKITKNHFYKKYRLEKNWISFFIITKRWGSKNNQKNFQ